MPDDAAARFLDRYQMPVTPGSEELEREVIGGDWGANGYTTLAQADELGAALRLRPGRVLLDLGAGRGWPGLYLAARTGCRVVLSDRPEDALRAAMARAACERVAASVVLADARALPLRGPSFDAVVHTDVLC